jgi:type I restriction enzyme S subunit
MTARNKNIPTLRFKEFKDTWKSTKYHEITTLVTNGFVGKSKDFYVDKNGITYIQGYNVTEGGYNLRGIKQVSFDFHKKNKKSHLLRDDLLTIQTGDIGVTTIVPQELEGANCHALIISRFKPKSAFPYFYMLFFNSQKGRNELKKIETGSTMKHLNVGDIVDLIVPLPSLPEQQKIASFLSAIDEKIRQLTRRKELLEQYKKGVIQQLFSGKLRFKDEKGKAYPKWESRKLNQVLYEHKSKSTGNEEVFSVSVHKGLVNQIEHLGRVFAAKNTDNYNLVKPNDIVYTKSPTGEFPLGIIKQSKLKKDVIVSPLYGIFTPETPGLGYMLNVYFETPNNVNNYLASIIQKGAKNTINITNTTFLSKEMKFPVSKEEQQKIGDFLLSIDTKIQNVASQIDRTQKYKKGLLQKMFV